MTQNAQNKEELANQDNESKEELTVDVENHEMNEKVGAADANEGSQVIDSNEEKKAETDPLQESLEKIKNLEDQVLRLAADAQNTKRRAEQDVQKARSFSIESFAKDLLSVMDNLERTSSVIEEDNSDYEKFKPILDGIEITKNEMFNVFKRNGIKQINPVDEKFDLNYHQAMSQIEDAEKESGTIIDVMQKGYTMKERLIRPALVITVK